MRRTARALSVAVLAGVAVGVAVPVAFADPAAEVSPSTVQPGGSVTVSVACDSTGGTAPATIEATSQAFDEETVPLQLVAGNDAAVSGPAYRGTARIASAQDLEVGSDAGKDSAWTVDGTCPAAPGGQGKQWSATLTVTRGGESHACTEPRTEDCSATTVQRGESHTCTEPRTESCSATTVQRGVQAGQGGAFADSVPALVTGGLLIAGALGGAVYRVRRKESRADV
ncbi:hypothetical protein [Streptomyces sp. WM6386]|uniref:hypothetical protein n=1 Tax=Streptomyces sp. WM6386 TaxID=1415558 RepID=UPI0006194464|nr:hypothetical protein [Streptomyces sp. WM6386]KKD08202.1 hypothetical protein TN53_09490 [Streptomyces sp. WM6386]